MWFSFSSKCIGDCITRLLAKLCDIWSKVFKNGPSRIFFKGCLPQILLGPFLNALPTLHVRSMSIQLFHIFQPFSRLTF